MSTTEHEREASLPAVHALHLVTLVGRWNVAPEDLLAPLGLREATLADPGARLSIAEVEALIARARTLTGEPGLGLYLGLQMRISSHGYLGFAAMSAATVGDAIALATRFAPTRTGVLGLRLHVEGDTAAIVVEERAPLGSARDVVILSLLVGIWQIGQALTGRELRGSLEVAFPEPAYMARFRAGLGEQLRFGQPAHRLVFAASVLALPMQMADPAARQLAQEQCERELAALAVADEQRVRAAVRRALPHAADAGGFHSLAQVARALGLSPRTLKRRLADEASSFSALLEEARRDRALLLLRDPELPLDQLAERLGYSDVANFTRAFRRWTGTTPGAFRRARGGDPEV